VDSVLVIIDPILIAEVPGLMTKEVFPRPGNEEYREFSNRGVGVAVTGGSLRILATTAPSLFRRLRESDALMAVNIVQLI